MVRKQVGPWRAWTPEDLATLRALAGKVPATEIAARLGRSGGAVRLKAKLRGVSLELSGERL
jgi:hypothetical protein